MICLDEQKETKRLLKRLPFYNGLIENPKNVDMLHELPLCNELNIVKEGKAKKEAK